MDNRLDLERRGRDPETVKVLTLDNCRSTGTNTTGISDKLANYINVERLSMINVGLTTLKGFPKLLALIRLDLSDNRLTGGLNHITESCPNLQHLILGGNRIRDMESLEPLKQLKDLKHLDMFNCDIESIEDFRNKVFLFIPQLEDLDGFDRENRETFDEEADDDEEDDEENGASDGENDGENGKDHGDVDDEENDDEDDEEAETDDDDDDDDEEEEDEEEDPTDAARVALIGQMMATKNGINRVNANINHDEDEDDSEEDDDDLSDEDEDNGNEDETEPADSTAVQMQGVKRPREAEGYTKEKEDGVKKLHTDEPEEEADTDEEDDE